MKHLIICLLFILHSLTLFSQQPTRTTPLGRDLPVQEDSLQKPPITAYKIFSIAGDTTFVDTTLTIHKDYIFNYLRRDNFELVPFANIGQPYNQLARTFKEEELMPEFGARARHFNFMEVEDIRYYEVPTPLTELYYKTVAEQGQTLDAFVTLNTSPRFNFSIAYKGLRSLGKYQNSLTSTGSFRSTVNYSTLNNRYRAKAHFVSQDLLNRENGGLNAQALLQYLNEEEGFEDRSLLEVKYENAENVLFGKRGYLNHGYDLTSGNVNKVTLHHVIDFSDKKYIFRQNSPVSYFGAALRSSNLQDEVRLRNVRNILALSYENPLLGRLAVKGGSTFYNYRYNSVIFLEDGVVPSQLQGMNYSAGAEYSNRFGPLAVYGNAMVNIAGDFSGHYLTAGMDFRLNALNILSAEINSNERAPNFNFLLYQSDYLNYNWLTNFENQRTRVLNVKLNSLNLVNLNATYTQIDNYTYFGLHEEGAVKPYQYDNTVNYIKVTAQREFHYGKFSLDNTLMYQNVTEGGRVFNVPDFVTRNSLYFRDHWFQRALYVQTGFTAKYFTEYYMNGYDPLLAEFYVQNEVELGGYPVVDFFFNTKIRQTRIFFKLEHLNSLITGNNNFSAPDYPYRDFLVRFGLVWNFFM